MRRSARGSRGPFLNFLAPLTAIVLLLAVSSHIVAHDPPEEYYDRRVIVDIEPSCVRVHYHVEISQVSLFSLPGRDKKIDVRKVNDRKTLEAAVMERFKVLLPDEVLAFLNDQVVPWTLEKARVDQLDSTHFHIWLRGDWKPRAGINRFELSEKAFVGVPGPYQMKFDEGQKIEVESFDVPSAYLVKSRGADPREEHRLVVDFRVLPEFLQSAASDLKEEPAAARPQKTFWQRLWSDDLTFLLSTDYGVGLLLLIALVHGAGHSLMPGHGKTMVAAYLVGERGTPWHAVLLGIVTTLTHTSAAIGVALLLRYVLPPHSEARVNSTLMFACGMMMLFIGMWLFLQRLAGRSDHVHLFDVGHSHGGEPPLAASRASGIRLVLLGIAGGIIPCWGAIMWVVGCIATNQFWMALPVVLCFSFGLAAVLILIGLSVVYAGRLGKTRLGQARWFRRVFNERTVRVMPVVGAGVIVLLGLFFCATSGIASN